MQLAKLPRAGSVCLMLGAMLAGCPGNGERDPGDGEQARSITVTQPADGAAKPTYPGGSTLAIRWSSTGAIANVRVELLYDASASGSSDRSVLTTIADLTENDGAYDWVVPVSYRVVPGQCVRVSDADDAGVFGLSCEITVGDVLLAPDAPAQPSPANDADDVPLELKLNWSDAARATSYDVYFGTSNPPPLAGNTVSSNWPLTKLSYGTTYYWSVVATNGAGSTPGPIWSFTTLPDKTEPGPPEPQIELPDTPGAPTPADGSGDVSVESDLYWEIAVGATSYDVYFGTDNPPPLMGNTNASQWTLATLSYSTTYYWNVVSKNSAGTAASPIWSFTTAPPPLVAPDEPSGPNPPDGAGDQPLDSWLDWDDAARAESYDVYFGTTDPPPFVGNTVFSDWTPATLQYNTTYYWSVTAGNSVGQTPGPTWSFTTQAATAGDMVFIPAGEFQMGDVFGEGTSAELPVHTVYVDGFYMDVCEVTNQQYATALNWALAQGGLISVSGGMVYQAGGGHPYCHTTSSWSISRITWDGSKFGAVAGKENHPMAAVSWYGAAAYCNWRSAMEGLAGCYDLSTWECDFDAAGYRLPTEAEWEKAARGGAAGHRYPWSDQDTVQQARANYWSTASFPYDTNPASGDSPIWGVGPEPYTSPVGFFTGALQLRTDWNWPGATGTYQTGNGVNGYGLCDMAGNVWEWVNDWYHSAYYEISPHDNPRGPESGTWRSMRGGSWDDSAYGCRVANRGKNEPDDPDIDDGFRCVRK